MSKRNCLILLVILFTLKVNIDVKEVSVDDKPIIYLTFDDGPNGNTREILDILDRYEIKATFFVTGTHPDYYKEIREIDLAGHTIGLHCFCHDYTKLYASVETYLNDLEKISYLVEQHIGRKSYYIRFPGGSSNLVSQVDMKILIDEIQKRGYQYFDWNGDSGDAKWDYTLTSVMDSCLYGVDGNKDIMLLCHEKSVMVEVLPTIIEYYLELGYIFLPITENTPGFHHVVN